jgi:hypothetical protein
MNPFLGGKIAGKYVGYGLGLPLAMKSFLHEGDFKLVRGKQGNHCDHCIQKKPTLKIFNLRNSNFNLRASKIRLRICMYKQILIHEKNTILRLYNLILSAIHSAFQANDQD